MDSSNLKAINDLKADKLLTDKRHQELITSSANIQDTILSAATSLIKYLEGHTTKTQVVNQLKSINTPDAFRVVQAVDSLHETLKTHENTDLSEVTKVMTSILEEAKKIPKELPKEQKEIDYTSSYKSLIEAVKSVEKVVQEQKLVAEAPIINVDKPDLSTIIKPLENIFKVVKNIELPKPDKVYSNTVELIDGSVPIAQSNLIISETYDDFRIQYDDFDDDNDVITGVKYYNKKKIVAELQFKYNKKGLFERGYKVKV